MKVAILSDTHLPARLTALPGVVYDACAEADLILHAGDLEDRSVIEDLERLAPVKAVHGNMDGMDTRQTFPDRILFELEGFTIGMTHGGGAPLGIRIRIRKSFQPIEPHIIVHGHTHEFFWNKENGTWFLNPGAIANPAGHRSMAILNLERGKEPSCDKISF